MALTEAQYSRGIEKRRRTLAGADSSARKSGVKGAYKAISDRIKDVEKYETKIREHETIAKQKGLTSDTYKPEVLASYQSALEAAQADYQKTLDAKTSLYSQYGFDPSKVKRIAFGGFDKVQTSADLERVLQTGGEAGSRAGEDLIIDETTFEVKGKDTGKVFGKGANLQEALVIQTQYQSGGTPSLSGAADVFAIEPDTEEEQAAIEAGTARVATEDELTGVAPIERAEMTPIQIRNVEELQRLAALGLSEADITRQGSAVFLNPGITEESLRSRAPAASGVGADIISAGMGDQVSTDIGDTSLMGGAGGLTGDATAVQTAQMSSLYPDRAAILKQQMESLGLGSTEDISGLMGTIGEGIIGQEKSLRELPETIRERTENVGVTNNQLNRLIATEREPIAQALKDLLTSRSLLGEQIAFAQGQAEFIEEGEEKRFGQFTDLLSMQGMTIDPFTGELVENLDARKYREGKEADAAVAAQDAYTSYLDALGMTIDPTTGEIIQSLEVTKTMAEIDKINAQAARARQLSSGGGGGSVTTVSNDKMKQWSQYLAQYTGEDGYVDTGVYRSLAEQVGVMDGVKARNDFEKSFPAEIYLNPRDATAAPFFGTKPSGLSVDLPEDEDSYSNESLADDF